MFLTTLLSALPLLNPALPVQEPVAKTGQKCTCSSQEPVAKSNSTRTKTGKTARKNANKTKRIYGKTSVNRAIVNDRISGSTSPKIAKSGKQTAATPKSTNNVKKRSQNALRRVTRAATAPTANVENALDSVKASGLPPAIGTGSVRVGIEQPRGPVKSLASIDTGVPQDNSPMWNTSTQGNSTVIWGNAPTGPLDSLANVDYSANSKAKTKKPAKKQNANKQVRKNRKR
jgi:hypothetical protein